MKKELEIAKKCVKEAGKIAMKHFGKATIKIKPDKTIVTQADIESETLIRKIITDNFPEHTIVGEEFGESKTDSEYKWFIDPVDGTTNFSISNPFFAVSVALVKNDEPVIGATYYPLRDELFLASRDKGAFLNNEKIKVSERSDIETSFITFCHANDQESTRRAVKIFNTLKMYSDKVRQLGAATLELCFVACGRTESFIMNNIYPWDIAAGVLIIEESGGKVTKFDGSPFTIYSKDIVASNGKIHGKLLELIKA